MFALFDAGEVDPDELVCSSLVGCARFLRFAEPESRSVAESASDANDDSISASSSGDGSGIAAEAAEAEPDAPLTGESLGMDGTRFLLRLTSVTSDSAAPPATIVSASSADVDGDADVATVDASVLALIDGTAGARVGVGVTPG